MAGGRAGAVGQLASAGLNAVGVGRRCERAADAGAGARARAGAVGVAVAVGVGAGVGVTTYGVYEGHGASGGTGRLVRAGDHQRDGHRDGADEDGERRR